MRKLKAISSVRSSNSEKETRMRDKDKNLQRKVDLLGQEYLSRELEDVVLAHMIADICLCSTTGRSGLLRGEACFGGFIKVCIFTARAEAK